MISCQNGQKYENLLQFNTSYMDLWERDIILVFILASVVLLFVFTKALIKNKYLQTRFW